MNMSSHDWLGVVQQEYVRSYLLQGGSAVKFVVSAEEEVRRDIPKQFHRMAQDHEYVFAKADSQYTKVHMIDRLFHKVARQIDWDGLAHLFLSQLLEENGYQVPDDRAAFNLQTIADLNDREEMLLRRELRSWLEKAIYRDTGMCQEFRMAMVRLCLAQLDNGDPNPFLANAVKDWLCGELRLISALKDALIFQKVARHNARDMLASLAYWVRLVGKGGLILTVDISQYMVTKRTKEADTALYYTAAAAMDAYEVLRQFVDGTDELEGCLIVVMAPEAFVKDERRGLNRYEALKLRIWDDVRDKRRQNPFAPLVRLSSDMPPAGTDVPRTEKEQPVVTGQEMLPRRAIEALRAGVPNRDAVQALGCAQPEIEGQFRRLLERAEHSVTDGTTTKGILLDGGFGTGKSHVLEYLQELALEKNFACSRIVISKETPLYSLVKIYRAAIETVMIPGKRGGTLAEVAGELNFQGPQYADFYEWVHGPSGELDSRFAATLFLYERMANDRELSHRLVRFWSGDPIGVAELKRYLQACSATNPYTFEKISQTDLALQRFKFASRLMVAAGYAGWILLIDEAEIIGRYSLKQRAKSYAELARWMGCLEASTYADLGYKSGLASVIALTDDFQSAILEEKGDREKIPSKLREGRSETDVLLADQAVEGMRLIEGERCRLAGPYDRMIEETQEKVRAIHASAYQWTPPTISPGERLSSTRMREYVKGWITEWDLKRLAPEEAVDLEVTPLRPSYTEDAELENPLEGDQLGVGPEEYASIPEYATAPAG